MAARSGGGSQSRQVVRPTVKGGPPRTNVVSPTSTDQLGRKVAYEKDKLPLRSTPAPAPLGNQVALNVGAGGPGTGRVLYGQAGTQSATPAAAAKPMAKGHDILRDFGPERK